MTAQTEILAMAAIFEKQLQEKYSNPLLLVKVLGEHGIDMEYIVTMVAELAHVSPRALVSKKRGRQHLADTRMVAMALCHTYLKLSYSSIGRHFNRHHSTVIHAQTTVHNRVSTKDKFVCNLLNQAVIKIKELTYLTL